MTKVIEQTTGRVTVHSRAGEKTSSHSYQDQWENIDWKRAEKQVRRLQERIYRAAKNQQWKKVRNLQKLLAKSYYNKLNAIRDVTEKKKGKRTPGIDNKVYDTPTKRWEISLKDLDYRYYKPMPTKRVNIPKSDGSERPLGIPTMKDRIMQSIIKTALEPEWEARFAPHSYGFRPGRNTMDAITEIRNNLAWSKTNVWILDGDISKCFDNISHEPLLKKVPTFRRIIKRWLRAGVIKSGVFTDTQAGTPQGGVISPLLANIALNGMDNLFNKTKPKGISLVRYADDFVVIAPSKIILERYILPKLIEFLSQQGLSINNAKTKIVHRSEGFNFLGFTIKYFDSQKKAILLVKPSKQNISEVSKKIKRVFRQILHKPLEEVIKMINMIIRGWTNYFRFVNAKKSFTYLRNRINDIIWKGLKRLHHNKSSKWIYQHYSRILLPQKWTKNKSKMDQDLLDPIYVSIKRYNKVKDTSSPFDRKQKAYWDYRKSRNRIS